MKNKYILYLACAILLFVQIPQVRAQVPVVTSNGCTMPTDVKVGGICVPMTTMPNPEYGIAQIISNLFSWILAIFSVLAIIAFIISGIQYLMAAGDEGLAETAKHNATNAVIGIIIGLSGFIIKEAITTALWGDSFIF